MIAEFILRRCRSLGLSKVELCRRAGISRETFYRLLRGDLQGVTIETLMGLANATQVAPFYLIRLAYNYLGAHPDKTLIRRHPEDNAHFVKDVTYADDDVVCAGQVFTKIWQIQNTGSVGWLDRTYRCEDKHLVVAHRAPDGSLTPYVDANLLPETGVVSCPKTLPGEVAELSVTFRAPALPCTAISLWRMYDADGEVCFPESRGVWCRVRVMAI